MARPGYLSRRDRVYATLGPPITERSLTEAPPTRADLTFYGTRHLMADWRDNGTVAQRTRIEFLDM